VNKGELSLTWKESIIIHLKAKYIEHILQPSAEYEEIADDLNERAKNISPAMVQEGDDTIIAVYTGGRNASINH